MDRQVYTQMAAVEDTHWWFVARRSIIKEILSTFVSIPKDAKILEAGCGTGGNLSLLAGFGEVSAFEPDTEARKFAGLKGNYDIRAGHLPNEIPFGTGRFDLVAAFDVLEHLEDDKISLQALWQQLRPGGWIFLTVPAFQFLWSNHDELHHHKRRYNKTHLQGVINAAGFLPSFVSYFNTLLFPVAFVCRFTKKILKIQHAHEDRMPPFVINIILRCAFSVERIFIGHTHFPFGLSLMMVAQKPLQ